MSKNRVPAPPFRRFLASVWLFPAVLSVILVGLTSFKLHQSSIGIYHDVFYGKSVEDPALIFSNPQPIRSDEWLVNTQLTLAQQADGYPHINENIGNGRDMSLNIDVPYKEWSVSFKPQNLVFFALPFEYAFAFKWWFFLYLLMIGVYFFALRMLSGKKILAILVSLGFSFSPFIFWWYQNITLAPLMYGFFILLLGMRIISGEPIRLLKNLPSAFIYVIYSLALAYLLVCFALVLYPPFQIPVAIVVALFLLGFTLNKILNNRLQLGTLFKRLVVFLAAGLVAGSIVFTFIQTRSEAISLISNTVYPGKRVVGSGGIRPEFFLTSYLQPQLSRDSKAAFYYNNPSEASNFILIMPFLIGPGILLLYLEYKKKRQLDWILATLLAGSLLFLARIFLPYGQPFYKLLFLHKVPNERLLIGIGFIGFLLMLSVLQKISILKLKKPWQKLSVLAYGGVCFALLVHLGLQITDLYPKFISSVPLVLAGSAVITALVLLILYKKLVWAMLLFVNFSLFSIVRINPLYRGIGPILDNNLSSEIKRLSLETDTWVTADNVFFENFGILNDRDTVGGVQFYPDLEFWEQVGGPKYKDTYNRYAHVIFSTDQQLIDKLKSPQPDVLLVKLECSDFVKSNVRFVLSTHPVNENCLVELSTVNYPAVSFFIYSVNQ